MSASLALAFHTHNFHPLQQFSLYKFDQFALFFFSSTTHYQLTPPSCISPPLWLSWLPLSPLLPNPDLQQPGTRRHPLLRQLTRAQPAAHRQSTQVLLQHLRMALALLHLLPRTALAWFPLVRLLVQRRRLPAIRARAVGVLLRRPMDQRPRLLLCRRVVTHTLPLVMVRIPLVLVE